MPVGPQYTKCVQPSEYEALDWGVGDGFAGFYTVGLAPFEKVVDYMLNKKLICLGGDRCVLGTVATFEEVGEDKNIIEEIDNDYCINLLLAPHTISQFSGKQLDENVKTAQMGPQGTMLTFQAGMPADKLGSQGYYKPFVFDQNTTKFRTPTGLEMDQNAAALKEIEEHPGKTMGELINKTAASLFRVPLLHCECEGSRIHDVYNALHWYPGGSSKFCKKDKWYAKWLCNIARILFAPFVWIAVGNAWTGAKEGDPDDARQDPEAGSLNLNDTIVIRGRWVFDAYHSGYNEIHAVRTVQKIPELITEANFADLQKRWCTLISEVPPVPEHLGTISTGLGEPPDNGTQDGDAGAPGAPTTGGKPDGMTPRQEEVYEAQRRPENRWFFHPLLDGCDPTDDEPSDSDGKP